MPWIKTKHGQIIHINASSNISDETIEALCAMMDQVAENEEALRKIFDEIWSTTTTRFHDTTPEIALHWFKMGHDWANQQRIEEDEQ